MNNTEIQQYINNQKKLYDFLVNFIDNQENDSNLIYEHSCPLFKIDETKEKLIEFLNILSQICENHHRNDNFFSKIEKIILYFKESINKYFKCQDIFDMFIFNKRIIWFLFNQKIISFDDEDIQKSISDLDEDTKLDFQCFFFPEIKLHFKSADINKIESKLKSNDSDIFKDFDKKRQIAENDSYICQLIREDSLDEFITYVSKTNYDLSQKVNESIFETNPLLISDTPTIIEYAAFFGSIQIFQYLRYNNIELASSIWKYAIHGRNPDIIHLLEENGPKSNDMNELILESLKCHHNELVNYFKIQAENNETNNDEQILYAHNYSYFPNFADSNDAFVLFCFYNYIELVKLLLKTNEIDLEHGYMILLFIFLNGNKISIFSFIFNHLELLLLPGILKFSIFY